MAPIGFGPKNKPLNIDPYFLGTVMAKIGQNRPKAPYKDVNDIKNFCFFASH
jgi:hypothetical protein